MPNRAPRRVSHHVLTSLARPGFRRLLASRLAGQFGDGVFQASLAGAVLFNPERQTHAADVAAGFAVLLLPYSLVGPFAGVLLDRWRRRHVLAAGNAARAVGVLLFALATAAGLQGVGFYAAALLLIGGARFLLAALSAALPHVLPEAELVTANAVVTTTGTLATAAGGAMAIGVDALLPSGTGGYAIVAATAALPWLLAALAARGFGRDALGPTQQERSQRETARELVRGFREAAGHVRQRPQVSAALAAVTAQRLGYGVTSVCVVLLYRNYYAADDFFRAGLAGLSQAVVAIALGGGAAALVTPKAFRRLGPLRWPALLLVGGAAVEGGLFLPFRLPLTLAGVLVLAFVAQGVKITVDTLVQQQVEDDFRGRVFALYDALFNIMLVLAAVLTATVLPEDGRSPVSVVVLALGYLALALAYGASGGRFSSHQERRAATASS